MVTRLKAVQLLVLLRRLQGAPDIQEASHGLKKSVQTVNFSSLPGDVYWFDLDPYTSHLNSLFYSAIEMLLVPIWTRLCTASQSLEISSHHSRLITYSGLSWLGVEGLGC